MLTEGKVRAIAAQVAAAIARKNKPNVSDAQIESAVEAVIRRMQENGELVPGSSISDEQIAEAVKAYFTENPEMAEYAASAIKAAEDAEASAGEAKTAADEAGGSASNAEKSATAASESATNAEAAQAAAENAKSTASQKAADATNAAQTATSKATEAAQSAADAQTAQGKAEAAQAATEAAKAEFEQKLANGDYKGDPYTLTEADKAEIVQAVIEALGGQPVAGYIDEDNNIVLTSALDEGTYTLMLEMADGTYHLGTVTVNTTATYTITWIVDGVTHTDTVEEGVVPVFVGSTDKESDGQYIYTFKGWSPSVVTATADATYTAVYEQTPVATSPTNYADPSDPLWQVDQRLATSYGYGKSCAGHILTNFVPARMGDVIYVTGLDITGTASSYGGSVSAFKGLPADSSNTAVQNVYQNAFAYTGIHESHDHAAKSCVTGEGDAYVYTILMGEDGQNRANTETTHIRIDGIPIAGKDVVIQVKRDGTWL